MPAYLVQAIEPPIVNVSEVNDVSVPEVLIKNGPVLTDKQPSTWSFPCEEYAPP